MKSGAKARDGELNVEHCSDSYQRGNQHKPRPTAADRSYPRFDAAVSAEALFDKTRDMVPVQADCGRVAKPPFSNTLRRGPVNPEQIPTPRP